jgi:hypothetical protein
MYSPEDEPRQRDLTVQPGGRVGRFGRFEPDPPAHRVAEGFTGATPSLVGFVP